MATRNKSAKRAAKAPRVEVINETKREVKSAHKTSNKGTIEPAKGKLGVMIPGMGAVATTFVAGVEAIRKGLAKPIGSLTQMGTVRLGKRTDGRSPKIKEFVPLAGLDDPERGEQHHLQGVLHTAAPMEELPHRSHGDDPRTDDARRHRGSRLSSPLTGPRRRKRPAL